MNPLHEADDRGGRKKGTGLLSAFNEENHGSGMVPAAMYVGGEMGEEETKAGTLDPPLGTVLPQRDRKLSTVTYDIGRTHCPTIFWGLMTTLTLLSAFLIVLGILVLNAFEISFGGAQDALRGQTVDTNLNIISTSGDATIHLRAGVSWEEAYVLSAETDGYLSISHGRGSEEPVLRIGPEGSLSTTGNSAVGGHLAALGFSSGSEGLTFADGSTMTTAASQLTGTSSDTDLNLIAGAGGGGGAIVMSTGRKERVRVDESGTVYFRGYDTAGEVSPLGSGVVIDGRNATVEVGAYLTLKADGISSPADIVFQSGGSIVLGNSPSAVTAVQGSLLLEEGSQVEIKSDEVSFTVSAQSYAESVLTSLPGGSSSTLATLNATLMGESQLSPGTAGLVWNSQEACESGEICVGYAGATSRWAAVSLALEGVRLEPNAQGGAGANYTVPPATEWVACSVEGSDGLGVLSVSGTAAVSDGADFFSSLGMTRHALLEPDTRYVVRCGTTHATGGPLLSDRVSLSMIAL